MKLVCTGSKNCPTYYIQKSVRIDGKSTTKTVERLGSLDEIKARSGGKDPIEWAKEYAKALTLAEKEEKQNIIEAALESLHKHRGTVNMKCGW